jgi:hypothetical protein
VILGRKSASLRLAAEPVVVLVPAVAGPKCTSTASKGRGALALLDSHDRSRRDRELPPVSSARTVKA